MEDITWTPFQYVAKSGFIAYPMVCFCDIPLSRIGEHTEFYGGYGIGLSPSWGKEKGLSPVLYVTEGQVKQSLIDMMRLTAGKQEEMNKLGPLISHCKPVRGKQFRHDKSEKREFFQECEWRFTPDPSKVQPYLSHDDFKDTEYLEKQNKNALKNSALKFELEDIQYLFVSREEELTEMVEFLIKEEKLSSGSDEQLKWLLLLTRLTSLETLKKNL